MGQITQTGKNTIFHFLENLHAYRSYWENQIVICFSSLAQKVLELWPFEVHKKCWFFYVHS